jgi:hypothetical protein
VDYQLLRNDDNKPEAIFSGSHLALGQFLTHELGTNIEAINEICEAIAQFENNILTSYEWLGREFKLSIENHGVSIKDFVLDQDCFDELPESTQLYDEDSICDCGLLDFSDLLNDWKVFCVG